MNTTQQTLIELALKYDVLKFGDFTLKSGRQSPYFFNAGLFNTAEALKTLGECYAQTLISREMSFDMLFGPAYKGIPLVSTTAVAMAAHQPELPYAFNRKEAKDHGEGGFIVGAPLKGRVLIVDDVISAGTAINESIKIIQQAGAELAGVLIALDRQERGQGERSAVQEVAHQHGIPVEAIITLDDLITYVQNNDVLKPHLKALDAYRAKYGV